jgi:hypothetical protein
LIRDVRPPHGARWIALDWVVQVQGAICLKLASENARREWSADPLRSIRCESSSAAG